MYLDTCFHTSLNKPLLSHFRHSFGDCLEPFCIQSCSKPLSYALAISDLGAEEVHRWIGQEPSGQSFNAITLDRQSECCIKILIIPQENSFCITCATVKKIMAEFTHADSIFWTLSCSWSLFHALLFYIIIIFRQAPQSDDKCRSHNNLRSL